VPVVGRRGAQVAQPGLDQRQHHGGARGNGQQQHLFLQLRIAEHVIESVQQEQSQLLAGGAPGRRDGQREHLERRLRQQPCGSAAGSFGHRPRAGEQERAEQLGPRRPDTQPVRASSTAAWLVSSR
jgi:hypothetical protein